MFESCDSVGYTSWERPCQYSKTYYVDPKSPNATDDGPGDQTTPFKTISRAAACVGPGERVVIAGGVYRECIKPVRGGDGPESMVSFEAAEGEEVVVKGSVVLPNDWKPSKGWIKPNNSALSTWQIRLSNQLFSEVNPFALPNVTHDRFWLGDFTIGSMEPQFRKSGMLFMDGSPLEQVSLYRQLLEGKNRFWVERNGLTLHISLDAEDSPANHEFEATVCDSVFAPAEMNLGYIRVSGITFEHAGNPFPVPQVGLFSANRGHHWIVENCTIQWANSIGIDLGNADWNAELTGPVSQHIVRNNRIRHCGICGIAAFRAVDMLVEGNLIEDCCWHAVEGMGESAIAKFHLVDRFVFRNNIVRNASIGCGIWLDIIEGPSEITGNVFSNIASGNGAILIEGSRLTRVFIANNVISNVRATSGFGGAGVFACGSDSVLAKGNIIDRCEGAGFFANEIKDRMINGRGGSARDNQVIDNLFSRSGRAAIEFANEYNSSEGNVYSKMPAGFLRIGTSDRPYSPQNMLVARELFDLEAWQRFHGWDKNGRVANLDVRFDDERLLLEISDGTHSVSVDCSRPFDVAEVIREIRSW